MFILAFARTGYLDQTVAGLSAGIGMYGLPTNRYLV
jgi:hypothetical protein